MEIRIPRRRSRTSVVLSIGAHGAVLGVLLWPAAHGRVRVLPPANRCCVAMLAVAGGSHRPQVVLPAPISSGQSRRSPEVTQAPHKLPDPRRPIHPTRAAEPTPPAPSSGMGSGTATGDGNDAQNVTPAFPVFSPKPPVKDRSLLPAAEQQIVVDVSLSADGQVLAETLVKGMGSALDQIVLDTVKTWRFQPATVNGNPVASEAELIFPFNPKYPISAS